MGVLLLLGSFLLGYGIGSNQNPESIPDDELTPIEKCIQEKREKFGYPVVEYIRGTVYVVFIGGASNKEIVNLLNKYNLTQSDYSKDIYDIRVPENSEFQWICTLEEEPIVDYARIYLIGGIA